MSDDRTEWGLVLPFDTDDPQFARGVAIGILWQRLEQEPDLTAALLEENAEMAIRIAEAKGLPFRAAPLAEGWLTFAVGADAAELPPPEVSP